MGNISTLTEHERFDMIASVKIDKHALNYLKKKLRNLSIQIGADYEENIFELMNRRILEGWCWQTTESAIVFLDDNDYIERGFLKFDTNNKYWHSWICFKFSNKKFVFDPCLHILVESSVYYHIFEISVHGMVSAKKVREELIYRINNPENTFYNSFPEEIFKKYFESYISNRQKSETLVLGNNDVNSPMYRNDTGYIAIIKDGKIKNLFAHFYYDG